MAASEDTGWSLVEQTLDSAGTKCSMVRLRCFPPDKEVPILLTCCSLWPPGLPGAPGQSCPSAIESVRSRPFTLGFLNWGLQKLITAIYADYARSLKSLGFKQGAVHFASKAGAAGKDLLNELGSPKEELTEGWHVLCRNYHVGSKVWEGLTWPCSQSLSWSGQTDVKAWPLLVVLPPS